MENVLNAQKEHVLSLRQSLRKVQRLSNIASWIVDPKTKTVVGSPQLYRLFDILDRDWISLEELRNLYHPDDRKSIVESETLLCNNLGPFNYLIRIQLKSGDERFLKVEGESVEEPEGILFYGTLRDKTEIIQAVQNLQQSEEEFKSVFRAMAEGVVVTNKYGIITNVNRLACTILDIAPNTLIGSSAVESQEESDIIDQSGSPIPIKEQPIARVLQTGRPQHRRTIGTKRKGGSISWLLINAEPIYNDDNHLAGAVSTFHDVTEQIKKDGELQRTSKQLRVLTQKLHQAQEDERARIARDIHDELGQSLTTLRMDLKQIRQNRGGTGFEDRVDTAVNEVSRIIQSVRRISRDLRPGILDHFGLAAALEWQTEQFSERTGLDCTFTDHTEDKVSSLPADCATALFRIYQEALTNVIRHAAAKKIDASIRIENSHLHLVITDDGRGISEADIEPGKSLGLLNMHERVVPWQGKVDVKGTPGAGTTVSVRLPFPL